MHKINFIPPLVFWDLKVLMASLGMPDPAQVMLQHQFVALIDMYLISTEDIDDQRILQPEWTKCTTGKPTKRGSPRFYLPLKTISCQKSTRLLDFLQRY